MAGGSRQYPARPIVGVGAVVLKADSVLLVRRGRPPASGAWSLPGGAQEVGETAEAGARRELQEETGLLVGPMVLVAHVDSLHHDDEGRLEYHYTILDFAAHWVAGVPHAGGDVTEAAFFVFESLAALGLWSEAVRVIALARAALNSGGGGS